MRVGWAFAEAQPNARGVRLVSDRVYRAVNLLGRGLLRAYGVRVRVEGAEHVPTSGPVLLAATHSSYPDFVLLQRAVVDRGRFVRFLCRHDAWLPGPISWALEAMRHVPVDRQAPAHAYLLARQRLREGDAVGVFPEAGISYSFTVRALMRGTAALARETGAPVVPAAIWGGQRLWSVGRPDARGRKPRPSLRRGCRVDVRFGQALRVPPDADLTEWTASLGVCLTTLLEEVQRLPEHRPADGRRPSWYPAHLGGSAPDRTEARRYDGVPRAAVPPSWGPPEATGASRPPG